MNNFTTLLVRNLLNNDENLPAFEQVIQELFRKELETSINEILKYELTQYLDYEKYERSNKENSRNGYYSREINSQFGPLSITVPRDRLCQFYTSLLPKHTRHTEGTDKTVIDLYESGMTNSDIVEAVEKLYGKRYSKQTVSNITDKIVANIDSFKNRPLNKEYAVIFTDATMMALRRDTVAKEAVHIAVGITCEGTKEVLGYTIAPNESAVIWKELLDSFKARGLERVALICTDGLMGMESVINETFPKAKIQRCIVHVGRNIYAKTRVKDRAEVANDFKKVYQSDTKELAIKNLESFKTKWCKIYPKVIETLETNNNLFTYYDFPKEIRATIYTTNLIEGLNKQIKRKFKAKEQFPTEKSMEKYLVTMFEKYNEKFMSRIHKGFGIVSDQWFNN